MCAKLIIAGDASLRKRQCEKVVKTVPCLALRLCCVVFRKMKLQEVHFQMDYRYMRIQGRENSYVTQYPKGVFSLCWNLIRDDRLSDEEKELFISIDEWFKIHLPEPEPCVRHEKVITFFKCDTTQEMRERLQPAMALLDKYQKPYDVVYTNFVGTIVYEDEWQIAVRVEDGKMI